MRQHLLWAVRVLNRFLHFPTCVNWLLITHVRKGNIPENVRDFPTSFPALGGLQIPMGWWFGLLPATLEFWVRPPNERVPLAHTYRGYFSFNDICGASLVRVWVGEV